MLKFTRKTDYAVQALLHMAARESSGLVSAREIAACHGIPVQLTAKLLQAMARAGLCESQLGPRGGYRLVRPSATISLRAIIEAAEGGNGEAESEASLCGYSAPLAAVQAELAARFAALTLEDLAAHAEPKAAAPVPADPPPEAPPGPVEAPAAQRAGRPALIYLDNQATTPLDPRVRDAMAPYEEARFGNAASRQHAYGWEAAAAVKQARAAVAALIKATPGEIVFTSGATESNNLALKGVAEAYAARGRHLVTCATEHSSVLDPLQALARRGWEVTVLGVDGEGRLDLAALAAALRPDTVLVSLMAANNEIGLLHPIAEIGALTRARGVLLHVDAAQAAGKIPLDVEAMGIDLLSLSAHKLYGPKGVGALYLRRREPRVRVEPQLHGGGHEKGLRSGTLNVPGIVGFGAAATIAAAKLASEAERLRGLRDELLAGLLARLDGVQLTINGAREPRLAGNLNLSVTGVDADGLLMRLRGVALSSASACSTATESPSHVLAAMGLDASRVAGALRFSLGRFTTGEEIAATIAAVAAAVQELRAADPRRATLDTLEQARSGLA